MAAIPTSEKATENTALQRPKTDDRAGFYRLASLALIVGALYFAKAVLVPLALAILLTFVLVPLMIWLERLRLSRPVSVLIVILCSLSATGSLGWMVEREFAEVVAKWPEYRNNVHHKSHNLMQWVDKLDGYRAEIGDTLGDASADGNGPSPGIPPPAIKIPPNAADLPPGVAAVNTQSTFVRIAPERTSLLESAALNFEELTAPFAAAFVVVVMLIFLLLSWEDMRDRALSLLTESTNQVTRDTLGDAAARVSRLLITQSIINLSFGAMAAVGLWTIHMTMGDRATFTFILAAGFLCGVLRFIPYVGVWIAASLPLAFTFAAYPGNMVFLVVFLMFLALEVFTAQVIEPRWLGASVGTSATGIMLSTVFWTWLWGPIGLLLSTPLTVLLVVMGKHLPRFRYLHVLLADRRDLGLSPRPKRLTDSA